MPHPKIERLSEALINQIAAGEVVDRPASVVKELVENALDAGATQIDLRLEKGGLEEIAVTDDGCGMSEPNLRLCVQRHTTSKISRPEDLQRIASFGFRGEALAAIAEVGDLEITTREADGTVGKRLRVRFGVTAEVTEAARGVGTDVKVLNLFAKIPARKKFMKSEATEFGHVEESLLRLALGNPQSGFHLVHGAKKIFQVTPAMGLKARLRDLLSWKKDLLEVSESSPAISVSGYVSPAHEIFGNRERFYFYVNGRFVKDRTLNHAVIAAYREVAPARTFPLVVLHLEIPPESVDVNVHPAKAEVRFVNGQGVHQFILHALRKALARPQSSRVGEAEISAQPWLTPGQLPMVQESASFVWEGAGATSRQVAETSTIRLPLTQGRFSRLRVIGQWRESFMVCEDPMDAERPMVVIDQHAAHERIGYERYKRSYKGGRLATQNLLVPHTLEVSSLEAARLEEERATLELLGFDVDTLGGNTILIRSAPALLAQRNLEGAFRAVVADLRELPASSVLEDRLDHVLMTLSCHTMIRANHRLTELEMHELLRQLDEIDFAQKCPHGRPILIEIALSEIERRFLRT